MQIHFFTRNTTDMHRYVKYLKIKHYNKTYYVCNKKTMATYNEKMGNKAHKLELK